MRNAWIYEAIKKVPENTVSAYAFAIICVVVATLARVIFGLVGASVLFTSYYPAVLVAALMAGRRAGLLAIHFRYWSYGGHSRCPHSNSNVSRQSKQ